MNRWSLATLAPVLHAPPGGLAEGLECARVGTDSRQTRPGDLFFALCGPRFDGHQFVAQAHAAGAVAAVVDRPVPETSCPQLVVPDTRRALEDLAAWHRAQLDPLVVGVTGSVGKTTTRELLHAVLATGHAGWQNRGNFNNEIGLPLTLLELAPEHDFAVLELGAARRGDIAHLCRLAQPEIGVVTRIGPAHVETFGSLENILLGKWELVEALPPAGLAIINGDDPRLARQAAHAGCRVVRVGELPDNTLRASAVGFASGRLSFTADGSAWELPAPGRHTLVSALAAVALGREVGLTTQQIAEGFAHFRPLANRCGVQTIGPWTVINDTYNASPLSLEAACELLKSYPPSRPRLLVLGDMLELGADAAWWHFRAGELAAWNQVDRVLACGTFADEVARGALAAGLPIHHLATASRLEQLLPILDCWLCDDAVVLVKGSRATRMERVLEWLRESAGNLPAPRSPATPTQPLAA
ncbi:MAG: UDP-N-acetylmuramoyl-tripeptide--D-alanyl-D-alanine ligase [Planctomycetaceae bacterium]